MDKSDHPISMQQKKVKQLYQKWLTSERCWDRSHTTRPPQCRLCSAAWPTSKHKQRQLQSLEQGKRLVQDRTCQQETKAQDQMRPRGYWHQLNSAYRRHAMLRPRLISKPRGRRKASLQKCTCNWQISWRNWLIKSLKLMKWTRKKTRSRKTISRKKRSLQIYKKKQRTWKPRSSTGNKTSSSSSKRKRSWPPRRKPWLSPTTNEGKPLRPWKLEWST